MWNFDSGCQIDNQEEYLTFNVVVLIAAGIVYEIFYQIQEEKKKVGMMKGSVAGLYG